ncbi:MAG: sulfotransferase family 2 domain-containing protein [Planctomycetia bacterium]
MMDLGIFLPLVDDLLPLIVCWTPKAGCTTVTKWFLFQIGALEKALSYSPTCFADEDPSVFGNETLCVHGYRTEKVFRATDGRPASEYVTRCEELLVGRKMRVIKVIRDPAERVVSNFAQFLMSACLLPHYEAWCPFLSWKRFMGFGMEATASFEQFVLYLIACRERRIWHDVHFAPQWHHVQDQYVERLIPIERFAQEVYELETEFRLRHSDVAALTRAPHHRQQPDPATRQTDGGPARAFSPAPERNVLPPSHDLLTEQMRRLIRMAYAEDYSAYSSFYPG